MLPSSVAFVVVVRWGGGGDVKRHTSSKAEKEREGKQDSKIVIIAYTNEKLITLQLAAQTVLLQTECRGQHVASLRLGGIGGSGRADGPKTITTEENQQLRKHVNINTVILVISFSTL